MKVLVDPDAIAPHTENDSLVWVLGKDLGEGLIEIDAKPEEATETFRVLRLIRLGTMDKVREQIRECEGKHPQQVAYSTYHDCLTQICFGCRAVRTNI